MAEYLRKFDPVSESDMQEKEEAGKLTPQELEIFLDSGHEQALLQHGRSFYELLKQTEDPQEKLDYELAIDIAHEIREAHGLVLVVGGFARDEALRNFGYNLKPKDIDLEVYGIEFERLIGILEKYGDAKVVGEFKVIKLGGLDISVTRRDSKTGERHADTLVISDPTMTVVEAARRRDFTINAMSMNPLSGEIIDKFGGLDDMRKKVLRVTDKTLFGDDPLRVLRAAQFAGRFGFSLDQELVRIGRKMSVAGELRHLSKERFEEEWYKLLLKSPKPSLGLTAARELGIIEYVNPELHALIGCEQEADWHPEGDVWTHTLMVVDEAMKIAVREQLDEDKMRVLLLGALTHDLGKPSTTKFQEVKGVMRITSYSHEEAGVLPARKFMDSINIRSQVQEKVVKLVEHHLFPSTYSEGKVTDSAIRRMIVKLHPANLKELVLLGEADTHGRGLWDDQPHQGPVVNPWNNYPSGQQLLAHAERMFGPSLEQISIPKYITGKKLMELGFAPQGKSDRAYGKILQELYQLQLDGKITGPEDTRFAELFIFLARNERVGAKVSEHLYSGQQLTKMDLIQLVKQRFLDEGVHDMGSLTSLLLLKHEGLPAILQQNKTAILTAHLHGPIWFRRLDRTFYETSWKSFYGKFEGEPVDTDELKQLSFEEQLTEGLKLIEHPEEKYIAKYNSLNEKNIPIAHHGSLALYEQPGYPFESGLMSGYDLMVQFDPKSRRLCISVMDENPARVKAVDERIRQLLPEFANAQKVGYLYASNAEGDSKVFTHEDAVRVLDLLQQHEADLKS